MRSDEILKTTQKYADKFAQYVSTFGVTFMSHGRENLRITTFGANGELNVMDAVDVIKDHPGLRGKPKLFFIQACRGQNNMAKVARVAPATFPRDADILFHFSTTENHKSFRSQNKLDDRRICSWFVYALCREISKLGADATIEIYPLLVRVNRAVAQLALDNEDVGQAPEIKSTMLKAKGLTFLNTVVLGVKGEVIKLNST